jgi:1-acyl-sn-glycerol-3-phosphate acyltransferase
VHSRFPLEIFIWQDWITVTELINTLTKINLDDLVSSFGWEERPFLSDTLRFVFRRQARIFARQMLDFDAMIGSHSLAEAAVAMIKKYARCVRVYGAGNIPTGSLLALSNHPGMVDTLALFAALRRNDLRIIADHNPFLNALPHVSRRLDYVTPDSGTRISVVRRVSVHLRTGGAVLTFPSGRIEPDPDVYPGAEAALHTWTDSVGVFVRLAPETAILPVVVRGVIWRRTALHPITRLKKDRLEREKMAAALQLLAHVLFQLRPLDVAVQIGRPITGEQLGTMDKNVIHTAVLDEMRKLLKKQPEGPGESIF